MARQDDGPIARREMPWWIEGAIALAMVAAAIGSTLAVPASHRQIVGVLYLVGVAPFVIDVFARLPDTVRIAVPLAALFVIQAGGARWGWLSDDIDNQTGLLIGVYVVGEAFAVARLRLAIASLVGFAAVIMGRAVTDPYVARSITWWAAAVFAAGIGLLIRALLRTIGELKVARDDLAAEAVAGERRRIARDVHDVVAHSMTVSMLHITAARMALARGDEPAAAEALEEAERAGRTGLRDVRATVGLLRDESTSPLDAPEPGLDDVDELVESWCQAGMDVSLERDDITTTAVGPAAGLALYRVVQEALANAARHLPTASNRVALARHDSAVEVAVTSTGARPATPGTDGHGLVGMRERVEALGGQVDAGPQADGWRVVATLPVEEPPVGTVVA